MKLRWYDYEVILKYIDEEYDENSLCDSNFDIRKAFMLAIENRMKSLERTLLYTKKSSLIRRHKNELKRLTTKWENYYDDVHKINPYLNLNILP